MFAAVLLLCRLQAQAASTDTPKEFMRFLPRDRVLSTAPALSPVTAEVLVRGPRDSKMVALTFDACGVRKPSRYDDRITETLRKTRTPATVFMSGKWMLDEFPRVRDMAADPLFELGLHGFLHPHLTRIPEDRIRQELEWAQRVLFDLTGRQARFFRPPYAEYDHRVVRIAAKMGLHTVDFDIASGDPDKSVSRQDLIRYVSGSARNGSIIVMHINRRGWHTADALPDIIRNLRKRGFRLVKLSDMFPEKLKTGDADPVGSTELPKPHRAEKKR